MRMSEFFFRVRIARNVTVRVAGDASGRRMSVSPFGMATVRPDPFGRGGYR